jgi:hypothetical protein
LEGKYSVRSSEIAMGRGGGAQRPVLHVNEPKKDGCAHARPKPTSCIICNVVFIKVVNKSAPNVILATYLDIQSNMIMLVSYTLT